jgi:hypothetical protein
MQQETSTDLERRQAATATPPLRPCTPPCHLPAQQRCCCCCLHAGSLTNKQSNSESLRQLPTNRSPFAAGLQRAQTHLQIRVSRRRFPRSCVHSDGLPLLHVQCTRRSHRRLQAAPRNKFGSDSLPKRSETGQKTCATRKLQRACKRGGSELQQFRARQECQVGLTDLERRRQAATATPRHRRHQSQKCLSFPSHVRLSDMQ